MIRVELEAGHSLHRYARRRAYTATSHRIPTFRSAFAPGSLQATGPIVKLADEFLLQGLSGTEVLTTRFFSIFSLLFLNSDGPGPFEHSF